MRVPGIAWFAVGAIALMGWVDSTRAGGDFDSTPVWPLCGRITENPPSGWGEADGCPPQRWGNPDHTDTPISSTFGARQLVSEGFRYDFHRGLDIATPIGTPVFAFADGVVRIAGPHSSYSDPLVQLRHFRDGQSTCSSTSSCYHTNYLHMSAWEVSPGDPVSKGDLIGYSGESASGFDHVHFEIRDASPEDPFSNWSRDAIHPLGVLPYHDTGTDNYQLALDSVDTTDPMQPLIYVTLTIPLSVELDFDGIEAEVYEHQPDGSLQLVDQAGDTPVGNTIEGTGYLVEPSWYSMNVWNRMYSYKNSSSIPWSAFGEGGLYESPYWDILPPSYNGNVHMDAADPDDFQVGLFNGWSWQPTHTNANSSHYINTIGLLSLTGTTDAADLCVQIRALDVHGNATGWVQYNCFPDIQSTRAVAPTTVSVLFTGPVQQSGAQNPANYAIDQGITVQSAVLQGDQRTVLLTTSVLASSQSYVVTVNNVEDLNGHVIAPDTQDAFTFIETFTTCFQDGAEPTQDYAGTRDTYLSEDESDTNHGLATTLRVDGSNPSGTGLDERVLLSWDVSSIPSKSTVQAASITLNVTNSGGDYGFHPLSAGWDEDEATWNESSDGVDWESPGADGSGDHGAAILGVADTDQTGPLTIPLNQEGIAVVQGWIDGTTPNRGLMLFDASSGNSLRFSSRESGTALQRPLLEIQYASLCQETFPLTSGQWKQIALTCDPGSANRLSQVFGDDLSGTYGTDWILFERLYEGPEGASDRYAAVGLEDPLHVGRGYWIKTLSPSQWVENVGLYNSPVEPDLEGAAAGRSNLVGHPFEFDVCWADVQVIDGTSTWSLDEAESLGLISRVANKWTGSSYAAFDGQTPGLEGVLQPWDGFWMRAYQSGLKLKIPNMESSSCSALGEAPAAAISPRKADKKEPVGWFLRLVAESGDLRDPHNVLGQLSDSIAGRDSHDLPEPPPFAAPYLSIVFPHPEWGTQPTDYTSDFHAIQKKTKDQWYFEVLGSQVGQTVTLSWEGPETRLEKTYLLDVRTGKSLKVEPGGSYSFTLESEREGFWWLVGAKKPKGIRE